MSANVELVYNVLAEIGKSTPTELIAKGETTLKPIANDMGIITTQKVSAYLNKLCDMGRVVKTIDKKKSYFSVVEN
jgi:predicted transcriptional regulator